MKSHLKFPLEIKKLFFINIQKAKKEFKHIVESFVSLKKDIWRMLEGKHFNDVTTIMSEQPTNINNSLRSKWGWTLLMKAAIEKQLEIFRFLASKPQDITVVNNVESRWNVLHFIVLHNEDKIALEMMKCLDTTTQLLKNGEITACKDSNDSNEAINQQTSSNQLTPLHLAAYINKHQTIKWLLSKGANPLVTNSCGQCPGQHSRSNSETKQIIQHFKK